MTASVQHEERPPLGRAPSRDHPAPACGNSDLVTLPVT